MELILSLVPDLPNPPTNISCGIPYKVLDNPNRIDVAMKYLEQGFFSEEEFEETLNGISSTHKETRFKHVVNQYVREYKLNKIL